MAACHDLQTRVEEDFDPVLLIQLTNVRDASATSINEAKMERACNAVINTEWIKYAQTTFDRTDETHLDTASRAVVAWFKDHGGARASTGQAAWDRAVEEMRGLARVTSRKRVPVTGTSTTRRRTRDAAYSRLDPESLDGIRLENPDSDSP